MWLSKDMYLIFVRDRRHRYVKYAFAMDSYDTEQFIQLFYDLGHVGYQLLIYKWVDGKGLVDVTEDVVGWR